jgi:hypothetical protein
VLVASAIWRRASAAPEAVTVQADGRIVTLSYRKGRRIVGEVTDAGGLRASSAVEVEARIDGERVGSDSVSEGGAFRLLVPADDERTVELTVAGRELMSGPVRDDPKAAGWRRLRLKGR